MLDKLKVTALLAVIFQILPIILPGLNIPDELPKLVQALIAAIIALVPVGAGWYKRESRKKANALKMNP